MSTTAPSGPRTYRPRLTGEVRRSKARELARDYEAGSTIRAIADSEDLSYGTVRTLLLQEGVKLRPRGGPAQTH